MTERMTDAEIRAMSPSEERAWQDGRLQGVAGERTAILVMLEQRIKRYSMNGPEWRAVEAMIDEIERRGRQ